VASAAELALIVKADASQAKHELDDLGGKATGFGKVLGDVGKIASGFLAANVIQGAGQKVMGFIGDSISAASDLRESVNAVQQIFGSSSQTILDWGNKNANSFGLSQRAFNQMATPMGAVLKNLGFSQDEVAESTINLTKRASDMASVFNTSVPDALEAINSALRGEANPIERYGVSVNAAAVSARALAMTGKESAATLTDQEKAAARLAIIFEQTDAVAGDFANTSGELANKTRIQQARLEELQATIGTKLLPVQLKITEAKMAMVNALLTHVIPVLEELYAKHWPAVAAVAATVQAAIEKHWDTISAVFNAGYEYVKTRIEGAIQVIGAVVEIVTSVVNLVSDLIHGRWADAWGELEDIAAASVDLVIGLVKWNLGNIPQLLWDMIGATLNAAKGLGQSLVDGFGDGMSGLRDTLINAVRGAWNAMIDWADRNMRLTIGGTDLGPFGSLPSVTFDPDLSFAKLARGGIVTRPTLAVVGEAGPEAVIPLNRAGAASREIVYVPVTGIPSFDQAVQDAVIRGAQQGTFRAHLMSA
jgi:phage-related protein